MNWFPQVETPEQEMLRLLREIHASVCEGKRAPRSPLTQHVLDVMKDGKMRSVYEVWMNLKEKNREDMLYSEDAVAMAMSRLVKKKVLIRIRRNVYQKT